VERSQYRWIAGIVVTLVVLAGAVVIIDPGAGGAEPANRQATTAYLNAQNRLEVAQEGALATARVAARRYADSVLGRCHGAIMGAPIPPAGSKSKLIQAANNEIELSREVLDAAAMATEPQFHHGQGQLKQLSAEATSVRWHDKEINTLMSLRAAEEFSWERLGAPDVCRDLKLWAQRGYGEVPATSHAFLKQWEENEQLVPKGLSGAGVRAIVNAPVTNTILTKLARYENRPAKRLGVLVRDRERKASQRYTAVALQEASRLNRGLGFDFCGARRGSERRCE
jgi:hypothetical protein